MKVIVVPHGLYTLQNAYNELLQTFFTNKWYKGHHNITPNSRRAIFIPLRFTIQNIKACLYQNKRFVQRLIGMKADMECVYSDDMYCYDALYMAVDKGNAELVKLFLSLGTNANVAYNEDGLCPLVMSCSMNSYPVTCLLLQYGAKANGLGNLGGDYITYPLMVAVDKNNINMVKVLLKYGAKTKVKDRSRMPSLSIARRHKKVEMIKLLEKSR
ncbi:ankyrin repeat domain-containing protein [Prevotella melaninogenica]|uniref:ankyrin repeat domain-containing protein n=2 Tax=Prevotella melaninogenica TaxID=28132 RepID=UPI00242F92D4|nr:ankyrin repeat domain-containing protein [Prevotella melaninogenica]